MLPLVLVLVFGCSVGDGWVSPEAEEELVVSVRALEPLMSIFLGRARPVMSAEYGSLQLRIPYRYGGPSAGAEVARRYYKCCKNYKPLILVLAALSGLLLYLISVSAYRPTTSTSRPFLARMAGEEDDSFSDSGKFFCSNRLSLLICSQVNVFRVSFVFSRRS